MMGAMSYAMALPAAITAAMHDNRALRTDRDNLRRRNGRCNRRRRTPLNHRAMPAICWLDTRLLKLRTVHHDRRRPVHGRPVNGWRAHCWTWRGHGWCMAAAPLRNNRQCKCGRQQENKGEDRPSPAHGR